MSNSPTSNTIAAPGPKSLRGKAKASQNSVSHGLRSSKPVIEAIGEKKKDWELHRQLIVEDLNPHGPMESALAQRIALAFWRLQRCVDVESRALSARIDLNCRYALADKLYDRGHARYGQPADEVMPDLLERRRKLRCLANHWNAILTDTDEDKDGDEVTLDYAAVGEILKGFCKHENWSELREKFISEVTWPPDSMYDLRSAIHWLCDKLFPENPLGEIRKRATEAERDAKKLEDSIANIDHEVQQRAETSILNECVMKLLNRYETSIHRALHRDLHELQRLQAKRQGNPVLAPIAIDVNKSK